MAENRYLNVSAYQLDELLIFSNQRSAEFLEQYPANVGQKLSPKWPSAMPVSFGALEANMFYEFNGWKLDRARPYLDSIFLG